MMTGTARGKTPNHWDIKHARQEGYDAGFAEGLSQSPDFSQAYGEGYQRGRKQLSQKPRPKLFRALLSTAYRKTYFSGYRSGYYDGVRKSRQAELKAIAVRDQMPNQEREDRSR